MNEARLAKLKHRATQAIESSRGDGFAEVVLELIEELERQDEQAVEPDPTPQPVSEPVPEPEVEVVSELAPTSPKRKRKVAEAGGDLSRAD